MELFAEAETWVGVGLLVFFAIVLFVARAHHVAARALDARSAGIKADLDEAARIRAEAQALLSQLEAERADAQTQAAAMLANARAEAERMQREASAKLEESVARRQSQAERKIAQAEQAALAEVKAAAADLAALAAEDVLRARVGGGSDPALDRAVQGLAGRLN